MLRGESQHVVVEDIFEPQSDVATGGVVELRGPLVPVHLSRAGPLRPVARRPAHGRGTPPKAAQSVLAAVTPRTFGATQRCSEPRSRAPMRTFITVSSRLPHVPCRHDSSAGRRWQWSLRSSSASPHRFASYREAGPARATLVPAARLGTAAHDAGAAARHACPARAGHCGP